MAALTRSRWLRYLILFGFALAFVWGDLPKSAQAAYAEVQYQGLAWETAAEIEQPIARPRPPGSIHALATPDCEKGEATLDIDNGSTARLGGERVRATGASNGDISTYDGQRYGFQAAGEFLLTGSRDGRFVVHARRQAVPKQQRSMDTAVAMQVGDRRVAIYAQNAPDGQTPVWIDAVPAPIIKGLLPLLGGGQLQVSGGRYIVMWPTGEQVSISSISMDGARFFSIRPEVPRTGDYFGLLVNPNGDPSDDLQIQRSAALAQSPDATGMRLATGRIPSPISLKQVERAFSQKPSRQFGESWRIAQVDSLFDD